MTQKNSKQAIRLPLYISIAIVIGIFIGANMAGTTSGPSDDVFKSLMKFRQVITNIQEDYVDEVNTDELVESAITEMLTELDPHSVYIPAKDLELTESQLQGNFEGIGVEFNIFKDTITVVTPLSGGPSENLGILPGDKIIKVDEENVAGVGITNRGVIDRLRGERGSKVSVTIMRNGTEEPLSFNITRDVIPQFSIDVSYMMNESVGYIKISRFAATTYMEFKQALADLQTAGMKKLILDLSGNPGGYMDPAVKLVDEMIADGKMIVYTKGKSSRNNQEYYSNTDGDFEEGTLIVLIDEGSASASEIVSGALQDHDRALIVGRRSFGKGLVQKPVQLIDNSAMRLTISRYYTPSGRCIQKPYNGGSLEDYYSEYYDRYKSGEIYAKDSMKINDSLVFETAAGRKVYGGGGIIPDVFVPMDSSENSRYMTKIFNSNSMAEYALKYVEENRADLEKMSLHQFRQSFTVSDQLLNGLTETASGNGVVFNDEEFEKSKNALSIYLKAFIARNIWGNEGFYPIFNEKDEIIKKAITLIDKAEKLVLNQP